MQAKNSETITDQLHNNCAQIPATLSQILPTLVFPPSWQTSLHWLLLLSFHLSISSNLLFNNCCVFLAPHARIDQLPVRFWRHANTAYYIVLSLICLAFKQTFTSTVYEEQLQQAEEDVGYGDKTRLDRELRQDTDGKINVVFQCHSLPHNRPPCVCHSAILRTAITDQDHGNWFLFIVHFY